MDAFHSIVRKTWRKMSERGHQTTLTPASGFTGDCEESDWVINPLPLTRIAYT